MSRERDKWDAQEAAEEVERKLAAERLVSAVSDPATVNTSDLLAFFIGLSMASAAGVNGGTIEGTVIDRDDAFAAIAAELDRRIPVPTEVY